MDLSPEIIIFRNKGPLKDPPCPADALSVYQDDNIRVMKLYDVAASPMQGRWIIRIDLIEE